MNNDQIKLLNKMKVLVRNGKRRFKYRKDRDYLYELLELGLKENDAWKHILYLNENFYINDSKPSYYRKDDKLLFKKIINNNLVYIKLGLELNDNGEETVCWSFHKDRS